MDELFGTLLVAHVGCGLMALGLFWAALAQRKGGARHRRLGRAYCRWMFATLVSAGGLAALAAAWPAAAHPPAPGLDAPARAAHAREVREFMAILAEITLVTGAALFFGLRAVRGPRARGVRAPALDVSVALAVFAGGVVGVVTFEDGEGLVVAGALMLAALAAEPSPRRRLRQHLIGVLSSGTAAHTAFVVSLVPRVAPGIYERDPSVTAAPWVLPPLLGLLGIAWALRRFAGAPRRRPAPGPLPTHPRLRRA